MAQNIPLRRLDRPSHAEPDLKPEEIELLSQINVQVGRRIASGNYGGTLKSIIYEGRFITNTASHQSGEKVAIKWLRFTKQESQMVWNELETLTEIKHPNIVDIRTAVWLSKLEVAIVMELATYGNVNTWIRLVNDPQGKGKSFLTLDQFRRFCNGLADAIRTLHGTGRAHWDLHKGNVIIFEGRDGVVPKLADFGSVKTMKTDKERDVKDAQNWDREFLGDLLEEVGQKAVKAKKDEDVQRVVEEAKKVCRGNQ